MQDCGIHISRGVLIIEVIGRGDIFQEVAAESEHLSLVFCSARTVGDPQDLEELCRAFEPSSLGLKVLVFFWLSGLRS